ncbi:MAG: DUF4386 family protein [Chloroflexi bacterium]|nr:DUF4386 family protein [Chloroflexota bacterium]
MNSNYYASDLSNAEGRWNLLYKLGGAASLLTFLYIPLQIITFMTVPEPTDAIGWFTLFQKSNLQGLLSYEFLFIVTSVTGIITTLALYVALKRYNESIMLIALSFSIIGTVCIIVARPAIDMLYLSNQYIAAASDAERVIYQTAGETLLAMRHGSAFHVCYNLANINLIIIPLAMLRSKIFNKATAYMGILAGLLGFGLYIPVIGVWVSVLSVVFMGIWDILIAIRLFQLGKSVS